MSSKDFSNIKDHLVLDSTYVDSISDESSNAGNFVIAKQSNKASYRVNLSEPTSFDPREGCILGHNILYVGDNTSNHNKGTWHGAQYYGSNDKRIKQESSAWSLKFEENLKVLEICMVDLGKKIVTLIMHPHN